MNEEEGQDTQDQGDDKEKAKQDVTMSDAQKAAIQHAHGQLIKALDAVKATDAREAVDEAVKELIE